MARIYRRPDRPGGTFYLDYFEDGRRIRRSVETTVLKEAKNCWDDIISGRVQARWGVHDKDCMPETFWNTYLEWAARYKSPRTVERETADWNLF